MMTTATKSNTKPATKSPAKTATKPAGPDAVTVLSDDHKNVKRLFKEYEKLAKKEDVNGKVEIAMQICEE